MAKSTKPEQPAEQPFRMHGDLLTTTLLAMLRNWNAYGYQLAQQLAEAGLPAFDSGTVYRTLRLLVECGLASARQFGDGHTRFEIAGERHHHDHLICTRCRTIVEFENDRIEQMQDMVARRHGFVVTHHKMELYGLCKTCREAEQQS